MANTDHLKKLTIYYQKQFNISRKFCPFREPNSGFVPFYLKNSFSYLGSILANPDHAQNSVFLLQ